MKKIFTYFLGTLSFISFIGLIGTAGALENDTISIMQTIIQAIICIVGCFMFAKLAKLFNNS